jgi:hypothetical protein
MDNGCIATFNIQVHDRITGTLATPRKEELQMETERQQELGTEGLLVISPLFKRLFIPKHDSLLSHDV